MHHVYVLRSPRNGKRYVGLTSKSPKERLKEHNAGLNMWTSHNGPFKLSYSETFTDKAEARRREMFFKSGVGRQQLTQIVNSR